MSILVIFTNSICDFNVTIACKTNYFFQEGIDNEFTEAFCTTV